MPHPHEAPDDDVSLRRQVFEVLSPAVRDALRRHLTAVAAARLEFDPRFPETAARWEAWWEGRADRPLLVAHCRRNPGRDPGKAFALLDDPEAYLAYRRRQVLDTRYVADGVPFLRVDMGPNALATFLGVPWRIDDATVTTWHQHSLEAEDRCWDDDRPVMLDPGNPWLRQFLETTRRVARDAAGRYLVVLPDLSCGADLLVAMRSPAMLCLDLHEHRAAVRRAALRTVAAWAEVYRMTAETIVSEGAGYMLWHNIWSAQPYDIPACDFSNLIGPDDFEEVCLPAIELQAAAMPRTCYHLDGPECARHLDALLAVDAIEAVQYTPGAGTPSALSAIDILHRIQEAGKSLLVFPPPDEVVELARMLDPRRLAMWVQSPGAPQTAARLARHIAG